MFKSLLANFLGRVCALGRRTGREDSGTMFKDLLARLNDELEESIAYSRAKLVEFGRFCAELEIQINAVQINDGDRRPQLPVGDGETVLGIVPDHLRCFLILQWRMVDELKAACHRFKIETEQILSAPPSDEAKIRLKAMKEEHDKLHDHLAKVSGLLERFIRETFSIPESIAESNNIEVRQGWGLVLIPKLRPPSIVVALEAQQCPHPQRPWFECPN